MARMTIIGPAAKVKSAILGGTPHPLLKEWFDWAKGQSSVVASSPAKEGTTQLEINSEDASMDAVKLALSEGFDVHNAPVFIKMSNSKYQVNVPVGIHEREVDDGQGNMVNRKWSEWKSANHNHMEAKDGGKIVPGNSWGHELTSDEIKVLLNLSGYTLYLTHEVGAQIAAAEAE